MTPEQYRRAGEIYHAALALPRDRRSDYLDHACGGDHDLRSEVESLLDAHDAAEQLIEAAPERLNALLQAIVRPPAPLEGSGDEQNDRDVSPADEVFPADAGKAFDSREPFPSEPVGSPLVPGQRIGRYEVLDVLGSGGMGTVYRALDSTLGRQVAIKALARTFRGDSGSLRRFEREARVLATLSHPNIATIYGVERLDDALYLVLERVDGETLAERLRRGALRMEETIALADQIIAGLAEAHNKGIVHRDLKPSNVMLAPDGRVKLVDFGLAKTAPSTSTRDTPAEPITKEGVVIGTARYMSPEQIKGEQVDTRTDVWAFGCVLYEMLTARPAFAGRSVSEVVAAVLRDAPDWRALPADTTPNVRRLLRRCLTRDPRARIQHIGDARLDLVEVDDDFSETTGARQTLRRQRVYIAVALAVIAGLAAFIAWGLSRSVDEGVAARLSLELPAHVTLGNEFSAPYAVAPDGSRIVFEAAENGTSRLYVRELTGAAVRALAGTEGARQPFFSPDGAWVGFFANRKLSKVPVDGGSVLHVADVGGNPRGATWSPDGTIVFSAPQTAGLSRVDESGGKPAPLTTLDKPGGEASHRWPDVLPGGRSVLFIVGAEDAPYDEARIEVVSLATGDRHVVLTGAGFARYLAAQRRLLFVRAGLLHSVEFDPERLEARGTPEVVLDPVRYDARNGGAHLAVSASGVLVYGAGAPISSEYYLAWVDRNGRITRAIDTPRPFRSIRVSPDGQRIATVIGTSTDSDLWLVDANSTLSRLSFALSPHRPTWRPDGRGITVAAQKSGGWQLLTLPATGTGNPGLLFESPHRLYPNAWSPDGRFLLFQESRPDTGWDLCILEVDASGRRVGEVKPFADTPFHETEAAIASDGRWVAYESDEVDGVYDIYVRSFPDGNHKRRVSSDGARGPVWDKQGHLHYWQTPDEHRPQAVRTIEKDGELSISAPEAVWRARTENVAANNILNPAAGTRYDLEPSGTRFLALERSAAILTSDLSHPVIVLGWRPTGVGPAR